MTLRERMEFAGKFFAAERIRYFVFGAVAMDF